MKSKNILVVGASGFIGSHVVGYLILQGYNIRCAVRDVESFKLKFRDIEVVKCDLNDHIDFTTWERYLKDIDIVINVAGLLNSSSTNKVENVHVDGPKSLLDAAIRLKLQRIVHISALGIDKEYDTSYANTKKQFDSYCSKQTEIDYVILKPSLVYANNCYGGTSLLRSLAALPFFIPLIGKGDQKFQPIHMDDLVKIIEYCTQYEGKICKIFEVVGPDIMTTKEIVCAFRNWMGLPNGICINIPQFMIKAASKFSDYFGVGPLNSTSYKMLLQPNVGDGSAVINFTKIIPRSFLLGLNSTTLTIQSLWHARLYLLQPIINIMLAIFWIYTGMVTIFYEPPQIINLAGDFGIPKIIAKSLVKFFSVIDIFIGLAALTNKYQKLSHIAQMIFIIFYTTTLTFIDPELWVDPLGGISKNIPILLLVSLLLLLKKGR